MPHRLRTKQILPMRIMLALALVFLSACGGGGGSRFDGGGDRGTGAERTTIISGVAFQTVAGDKFLASNATLTVTQDSLPVSEANTSEQGEFVLQVTFDITAGPLMLSVHDNAGQKQVVIPADIVAKSRSTVELLITENVIVLTEVQATNNHSESLGDPPTPFSSPSAADDSENSGDIQPGADPSPIPSPTPLPPPTSEPLSINLENSSEGEAQFILVVDGSSQSYSLAAHSATQIQVPSGIGYTILVRKRAGRSMVTIPPSDELSEVSIDVRDSLVSVIEVYPDGLLATKEIGYITVGQVDEADSGATNSVVDSSDGKPNLGSGVLQDPALDISDDNVDSADDGQTNVLPPTAPAPPTAGPTPPGTGPKKPSIGL